MRRLLEKHAKRGEQVSYEQVAIPTMLSVDMPDDRKVIDNILEGISRGSHAEHGALLSVLVREKKSGGRPCDAFFKLAKALGYKYADPDAFVEEQIRKLFDAYDNPTSEPKPPPVWVEFRGRRRLIRG